MGLYVHSLAEIPTGAERSYYLYLLDYGWEEPLGKSDANGRARIAIRRGCYPRTSGCAF
jgi:hypothetical protein